MNTSNVGAEDKRKNSKIGWLYAASSFLALMSFFVASHINGWVMAGLESSELTLSQGAFLQLSQRINLLIWITIYAVAGGIGTINPVLWRLVTVVQLWAVINVASLILIFIF